MGLERWLITSINSTGTEKKILLSKNSNVSLFSTQRKARHRKTGRKSLKSSRLGNWQNGRKEEEVGEKYNGKEDSQEGGEQREVGCLRNIIETHAIMENRGRIDAKRERERSSLDWFPRLVRPLALSRKIRSDQDRLLEPVVVNQLARTRVSDETFTVY